MHYENCKQTKLSKLFCMTKELIVNDKINITEYTDTFFEEYFKTPYINTDNKKNIKFEMKIKCGMPISDDITGSNINFYLSNVNDNKSEFDIMRPSRFANIPPRAARKFAGANVVGIPGDKSPRRRQAEDTLYAPR